MLPEFLFSTYKQYKTDTDKITTWLVETAKKCGYKSAFLDPNASGEDAPGQNGKPPKLKGRARKLARDAAAAEKKAPGTASAVNGVEKKFTVPVREFEVMAEHIARSQDASLKIPRGFINLMKRCIKTRRGTSDWFQENVPDTTADEADSTERHLHFANVLQRTLQTLLPVDELRKSDNTAGEPSANTSATEPTRSDLANAFSLLKVDEAEDEDFDPLTALVPAAGFGENKAPAPQRVRYQADMEDDGEEWFFALHCFFFDMHELRIFLAVLWSVYKAGQVDLATAAVTTNTAYDLMRRAEDDFNKEMRIPKEYAGRFPDGSVVELYYIDSCLRVGLEPKDLGGRTIVDFERWLIVQESFQLPYRLLVSFSEATNQLGSLPVTRPAEIGTYTPGIDRAKLDPKELSEQDGGLLMDFLTTVGPYVSVGDTPNDDELMRGIQAMLSKKKGKIPLWLVFAAQNYLDIHHILMKHADGPLDDLQEFAREAQSTLREHFTFLQDHSLSTLRTKKSENYVHDTLKEIEEWALEDRLMKIMKQEIGKGKQKLGRTGKTRTWKPNELLKMHPLLCGMMKYSFHLQLQWEGVRLLNETGVMTAAHLYNALKRCGYLPEGCQWEDMDLLIEMHGRQDIFLGDFPTTIEDCTKRLAMFQGVSAQTFANNRRRGGQQVIFSKNGGRVLKQASPIASIFRNRFLSGGSVDFSIASVEVLLGRRMEQRKTALDNFKEFLRKHMQDTEVQDTGKKGDLVLEQTESPKQVHDDNGPAVQTSSDEAQSISADGFRGIVTQQSRNKEDEDAKVPPRYSEELQEKEDGQASTTSDEQEDRREPDQSALVRWHKHHQLSIQDLLTELSDGLCEEHLDLQYDYFGLFRRVWQLLEAIQSATMPLLEEKLDETTAGMMATREGVPMVPAMIMLMACDPREAPNIIALKNWLDADDGALKLAADLMKDFVEREGSVEAEREGEVQARTHAEPNIDPETARALDEIKSIRAVTGAVPIDDGQDSEQDIAEAARRLLASTADSEYESD
jgi:hypothetical protein